MFNEYLAILKQEPETKPSHHSKEAKQLRDIIESAIDGNSEAWNAVLELKRLFDDKQINSDNLVVHPLSIYLRILSSDSFFSNPARYDKAMINVIQNHPEVEILIDSGDVAKYFTRNTQMCASILPSYIFKNRLSDAVDVSRAVNEIGPCSVSEHVFCSALYYINDIQGRRRNYEFFYGWPNHIVDSNFTNLFYPFSLFYKSAKKTEISGTNWGSPSVGYFDETTIEDFQKLHKSQVPSEVGEVNWAELSSFGNDLWVVLDLEEFDSKPENNESYNDNQRTRFKGYYIYCIFHKWRVLLDIIESASNNKMITLYPEFSINFKNLSSGKEEFSEIGLHLIGCAMALFKIFKEIRELNIDNEERSSLRWMSDLEINKHWFFGISDSVSENTFVKIAEKDALGSKLKAYFDNYYRPVKPYKPYYFGKLNQ